jgi:glycosyltransferase involved in cell wall biosynthesis
LQDNLPNTILESLACGTPIVGFDSSGISEMVQSSKTGVLIPVNDTDKLGASIADLINNDRLRAEMVINCRQTALKLYASSTQARKYLYLYESMIGRFD